MRFTKEVVLNKPIDQVRILTSDPGHLHHWQPELVGITQHSQTPGAVGSTATLTYRKFKFEETVLAATADERTSRYETRGMVHTITNRYRAIDDRRTMMVSEHEIRTPFLLRLFHRRIAKVLQEESERGLASFKAYVDNA